MKKLGGVAFATLLALLWLAPAVLAADPAAGQSNRVVVAVNGDVTIPAGDQADMVVVVRGAATIQGDVATLVVVDGAATLTGARAHMVVAVRSPITLGPGTVVSGDVMTVDSLVHRLGDAQVTGQVRDLASEFAGIGFVFGPLIVLWLLGLALVGLTFGLLLAGLAARQVRAAERSMAREPLLVIGVGVAGVILPILVAVPLFATIVGAPLALALLFGAWPLLAFVGYLVSAIAIGDWLLGRLNPTITRERPYLAAVLGVVVLDIATVIPPLVMLASLFGFGALLLLIWRTLRPGPAIGQLSSTSRSTPGATAPVAS